VRSRAFDRSGGKQAVGRGTGGGAGWGRGWGAGLGAPRAGAPPFGWWGGRAAERWSVRSGSGLLVRDPRFPLSTTVRWGFPGFAAIVRLLRGGLGCLILSWVYVIYQVTWDSRRFPIRATGGRKVALPRPSLGGRAWGAPPTGGRPKWFRSSQQTPFPRRLGLAVGDGCGRSPVLVIVCFFGALGALGRQSRSDVLTRGPVPVGSLSGVFTKISSFSRNGAQGQDGPTVSDFGNVSGAAIYFSASKLPKRNPARILCEGARGSARPLFPSKTQLGQGRGQSRETGNGYEG